MPNFVLFNEFEIPDCPGFGPKEERKLVERMKEIRSKVFDQYGNKLENVDPEDWRRYGEERQQLALKYSFVILKVAHECYNQCRCGMELGDLFNSGMIAVLNAIDKWPPFLGKVDKGIRLLTSIQTAVQNAIYRFLDDNNRTIKIPAFRNEQLNVKLKINNLLYGNKKSERVCQNERCPCAKLHSEECNRNKPGIFEHNVMNLLNELNINLDDVDDKKSLADIAVETGRYSDVAKVVHLDVQSLIRIIRQPISTSISIGPDKEDTIADLIPARECEENKLREVIEEVLKHVPQRNAEIIKDRFLERFSNREIARKYGFSVTRATQMIKKSINQIKNNPKAMEILVNKVIDD